MKRSQEKDYEKRNPGPVLPRRYLLWGMAILGTGLFAGLWMDTSIFRRIFYRIQDLFSSPQILPPQDERKQADLPPDGYNISVETALNSRCTSDRDGNPKRFHWGMFDPSKSLSEAKVRELARLAQPPRLSGERVWTEVKDNEVTFLIDERSSGPVRDGMMVESGMQQQALGLICACFGAGMVFRNLGVDGSRVSDNDFATIKIIVDAMSPSYDGKCWVGGADDLRISMEGGSLPEPQRQGNQALLATLQSLKSEEQNGGQVTEKIIGQMLWAARGRTPHYYKSRPWGMTIPTWGGEQNISSLYLVSGGAVWKYVNWQGNRPAHSVEAVATLDPEVDRSMAALAPPHNCIIVQTKNENSGRALWEIGYSLLNMILQAKSLGLAYKAVFLEEKDQQQFKRAGIDSPVSAVFLGKEERGGGSVKGTTALKRKEPMANVDSKSFLPG